MASGSPASAAPAKTYKVVEHNVTLPTQFFPDDICGLRASFETATYKTMITKITEDANGGFHLVDFETGSIAFRWPHAGGARSHA